MGVALVAEVALVVAGTAESVVAVGSASARLVSVAAPLAVALQLRSLLLSTDRRLGP
jgi:hypothetical protein